MNSKLRKLLIWGFIIFFAIPMVLIAIMAMFTGNSEERESKSLACITASAEDLKNIEEGLTKEASTIEKAFTSDYSSDDVKEITAIFPTFKSPRIVAAQIDISGNEKVIGLWGIQTFDYGWRVLALNQEARQYSNFGVDIDEDSASGRVRSKMLELSSNKSALDCAR
jgi:hypothetical protein